MTKHDPTLIRCHAKSRNGKQCGHYPMAGQRVCHMHGGRSPQALRKAEDRMRELVDPAIASLARQIEADEFNAVRYVLDYAGYKATVTVNADHEVTIRVIDEAQPIVLEQRYQNGLANGSSH